jgi:NTE family protein
MFLSDKNRSIISTSFAAMWGNPKAFIPKWAKPETHLNYQILFGLPYPLFDITPLRQTLSKYVDFAQLKKNGSSSEQEKQQGHSSSSSSNNNRKPRLIVTCTDIQRSEPVVFDSNYVNIDIDHIIACIGFPFYGIGWTQKDGRYLWDGSLLSNTPLIEVIDASPVLDKRVYIVNLFPRYQEELPNDMLEAWHRARDIMYTDKTYSNVRTSEIISRYLSLLNEMHDVIHARDQYGSVTNTNNNNSKASKEKLAKIEEEYSKLAYNRGTIIQDIIRIERTEESRFLFEDADFSTETIKKLISQGERDTDKALIKEEEQ